MSNQTTIVTTPSTVTIGVGTGLTGPAGPTGPVPFIVVGPWEAATVYTATAPADAARFGGGLYQCVTSHTSGAEFDPTKWLAVVDPPPVYW